MPTVKERIRSISELMKDYRIYYPMTQKQLADRSGVSLRCIQRFEKGEDIQLGNLLKLLNALGLEKNVEMLVPDVKKRPAAFVEKSVKRQRARTAKGDNTQAGASFKWGDDE